MNEVVFGIIKLLCGLTFFLYGMNVMSSGLEKVAGSKMESMLRKMTSNPIKSLVLGAGITIAIQSSSAVTVMLVGLVNSGVMHLSQTVGVIMGSNVGTTLTAWILSLAGIESDNLWMNLLKPENFSAVLAFIGIIMLMVSKKKKRRDLGTIFIGFAVLMYGMEFMGDAVSPLKDVPEFQQILTMFENPILGLLVGAAFTGIIQSSAASVGILQSLALTGSVTYGVAIPIIMGQNIGTCVTALLSSIGVNKNAKRVSAIHMSFNIIGSVFAMVVIYGINMLFPLEFLKDYVSPFAIAVVHSIFNVTTTLLLLPFAKLLVKLANKVIRDTDDQEVFTFIDQRLFATPSIAISECKNKTTEMARKASAAVMKSIGLMSRFDDTAFEEVFEEENELDNYEDKLGTALVKLAGKDISDADSKQISILLNTIGDFERIGDHSINIAYSAKGMKDKNLAFSPAALKEFEVLDSALQEILDLTVEAFDKNDVEIAKRVEPLEQTIDKIIGIIKARHIERLRAGECTVDAGIILSDVVTNYERVSDHCSNIAVALIEIDKNEFEAHEYLHELKDPENEAFRREYRAYKEKYSLK